MWSSFLNQLNILLLSFYYPPDIGPGSLRAASIVDALVEKGKNNLKIDVLTTMPNRYSSYYLPVKKNETYDKVSINRVNIPTHKNKIFDQSKSFIFFYFEVLKFIRKKRYDIVVATSSRLMTAALGAYVANKKKTKLYLDIRDIFTDTLNSLYKNNLLKISIPLFRRIEKWTFNSADRINIVSGGFENYFKEFYPNANLTIHTNGIDDDFLNYKFVKKQNNKKYLILYAGNIGDGQGLDKIIPKIASKNPNIKFKLIGDGSTRNLLIENDLFKKLNNIEVINPISRRDLIKEYEFADILLLHLNDYEAFQKVLPSKIFEYAATNKPILAGVSGFAAEFLKREINGVEIFSPCNDKEMNEGIYKIINNPKMINRKEFFIKYRRKNIINKVASDILLLINK